MFLTAVNSVQKKTMEAVKNSMFVILPFWELATELSQFNERQMSVPKMLQSGTCNGHIALK